ncbi:hypothetical protein MASR2M17_06070 [Aminivibrio sp.]
MLNPLAGPEGAVKNKGAGGGFLSPSGSLRHRFTRGRPHASQIVHSLSVEAYPGEDPDISGPDELRQKAQNKSPGQRASLKIEDDAEIARQDGDLGGKPPEGGEELLLRRVLGEDHPEAVPRSFEEYPLLRGVPAVCRIGHICSSLKNHCVFALDSGRRR